MNGSIRVSAKTVDEAIIEASIQLAVTSDMLDYEIIEKGREGFLGIGARQAVIEARKKSEPVQEKSEEKPADKPEKKPVERPERKPADKPERKPSERPEPKKTQKSAPRPEKKQPVKKAPAKEEIKKDRRKNENHVKKEEKVKAVAVENTEQKKVEDKVVLEAGIVTDEIKKSVEEFLNGTLNAMGISAGLLMDIDKEGALCIEIKGENMGILIGKRGQTLDALQYLANRVANRHRDGYVRVKLDTENYRSKRAETLKNLAKNIAIKVKRTRKPVSLEPMNPYERRIIHSALQSDPRILTHSEGEEPYRKVVITLKK